MTEILAAALEAIAEILEYARKRRQTAGLDVAADALTAIGAIVQTVRGGKIEDGDLDRVRQDLATLRHAIASNDAAADAALAGKFVANRPEEK